MASYIFIRTLSIWSFTEKKTQNLEQFFHLANINQEPYLLAKQK